MTRLLGSITNFGSKGSNLTCDRGKLLTLTFGAAYSEDTAMDAHGRRLIVVLIDCVTLVIATFTH